MKVVGLTGGIGSGKSTVAALFAQLGVPVVDTDLIAHQLSIPPSPALEDVAAVFGKEYLGSDGALDRARMRERIFEDPAARIRLDAIFHPRIRKAAQTELASLSDGPYALLVVPLLFEADGFRGLVDRSLVVNCTQEQQLARILQRSGINRSLAERIILSQLPPAKRLALADDILENNGSLSELQRQVEACHDRYLKWANDH
ncbi:dephospho-CoA kinase [Chitiniphilus shinanonensis]|uniref:Dephospho-CoA kinase n=1 Tax=Chitiniphilus shinanonensis TaxID=553088 RepID=A0ABQ6BPX2_9NEIS|nr:dephospho-CoA kinase [Chitiniphilus shinanonensis]GLS03689.1 dephospho-CoA kinase [Chitiniphilus shinanonensis]